MENPDPSEVGQAPPKIDRPCAHCGRRNAEKLCRCTTIATELCDNCVVPHIDANQHLTHLTAKLVIAPPLEDDLELDDVTPEEHVKLINTNRLNHRCDEIKAELQKYLQNRLDQLDDLQRQVVQMVNGLKAGLIADMRRTEQEVEEFLTEAKTGTAYDYILGRDLQINFNRLVQVELPHLKTFESRYQVIYNALQSEREIAVIRPGKASEYLAHFVEASKTVLRFNCRSRLTDRAELSSLGQNFGGCEWSNYCWISPADLLVVGLGQSFNGTVLYNWIAGTVGNLAPTGSPRSHFAIGKIGSHIYAFGGDKSCHSAEVYDLDVDIWTALPNLPSDANFAVCTVVKAQIYIAAYNLADIIRFSPNEKSYSPLGIQLPEFTHKRIAAATGANSLVVLTDVECKEVRTDGQVSNVFQGVSQNQPNKGAACWVDSRLFYALYNGEVWSLDLDTKQFDQIWKLGVDKLS